MTTDPTPADISAREDHHPVLHDSPRPPRWFARSLVMTVVAVFLAIFAWYALGTLQGLGVNLLISFFVALALEPITVWLVKHGWKRGLAAFVVLIGSILVLAVVLSLFGGLFLTQLTALVESAPSAYASLSSWLSDTFGFEIPDQGALINSAVEQYGEDVATQAIGIGSSILGGIFSSFTILLVTYYLVASGPRFRAAVCRWLTPNRQEEVLRLWEVTQVKVSDFITSRVTLAALNAVFTFVFLSIIGTPYSVPLALFCGIVSQFIPTIGTYIGGALPVLVALTSQGPGQAIATLVFIVLYQQVENLFLAPKISAKALEMNPAVSFIVVLAFGAVFGPLGAFLGLPIAATIQAIATTYIRRHELIESEMLKDPEGVRPSSGQESANRLGGLRMPGRRRSSTSVSVPEPPTEKTTAAGETRATKTTSPTEATSPMEKSGTKPSEESAES